MRLASNLLSECFIREQLEGWPPQTHIQERCKAALSDLTEGGVPIPGACLSNQSS